MAPFKNLWRILTLHCEEASGLASREVDGPLPAADKVALDLHGVSCRSCRRNRQQLLAIHRAAAELARHEAPPAGVLPDEARSKIKQSLKK